MLINFIFALLLPPTHKQTKINHYHFRLDIDINDNNPHLSSRSNLSTAGLTATTTTTTTQTPNGTAANGHVKSHHAGNGIGHKAIAGLMVPSSTAQSYAAIAHAAAAAAAQQNRNNQYVSSNGGLVNDQQVNMGQQPPSMMFQGGMKPAQSYNNPSFFESTSYAIVI